MAAVTRPFRRLFQAPPRDHVPMARSSLSQLLIVPGDRLVLFIVRLDGAGALLAVRAARFLDGLKAAGDLLGFGAVQREDPPLDELLPWAGNV